MVNYDYGIYLKTWVNFLLAQTFAAIEVTLGIDVQMTHLIFFFIYFLGLIEAVYKGWEQLTVLLEFVTVAVFNLYVVYRSGDYVYRFRAFRTFTFSNCRFLLSKQQLAS